MEKLDLKRKLSAACFSEVTPLDEIKDKMSELDYLLFLRWYRQEFGSDDIKKRLIPHENLLEFIYLYQDDELNFNL